MNRPGWQAACAADVSVCPGGSLGAGLGGAAS